MFCSLHTRSVASFSQQNDLKFLRCWCLFFVIYSCVLEMHHSWDGECGQTQMLRRNRPHHNECCSERVPLLSSLLLRWRWNILVVDEAHRLKDQNSLLHRTLTRVLSCTRLDTTLSFFFTLISLFELVPLTCCVCEVLSWLQSPADGDPHPEQPAGALLAAELHPAQHLRSWWDGQLRHRIFRCTESACSWYDGLLHVFD